MPVLIYGEGASVSSAKSNGLLAVKTEGVLEIERAVLPGHSVFIVQSETVSTETWEGQRLPRRKWNAGDLAFLPETSELQSKSETQYNESILSFSNRRLIETARAYIERSDVDARFADITMPDASAIAKVLYGLVSSGEAEKWPLLTDSLSQAMLVTIVRQLAPDAAARMDAKSYRLDRRREKRAMEFVDANIGNAIRLGDMAGAAAMSQYHFSRSFKQSVGVSPTRYVLLRRIREAQMLLRMTDKALADIALQCGFASQSHFTTAFKTEVGVTPGEYRRCSVE